MNPKDIWGKSSEVLCWLMVLGRGQRRSHRRPRRHDSGGGSGEREGETGGKGEKRREYLFTSDVDTTFTCIFLTIIYTSERIKDLITTNSLVDINVIL